MHLVDEPGQHVTILNVEAIVGPEGIDEDDGGVGAAVLLEVGPVLHLDHPLGEWRSSQNCCCVVPRCGLWSHL